MMRWIVRASLKSRALVLALGAVVIGLAVLQVRDMPRDVLPEFSRPTVRVQTEALGLSALDVEQLITVPLEQDLLNGVAFLDSIRSKSVAGLSSVELIFERGTDLNQARQVVNERLTQAHGLPNISTPPQMLQSVSSTSRVMMIPLSSNTLSLVDLGVLARWTIRPRLMGVPGVANVAVWGQRERQLQVQIDPAQLQAQGVSLDQVITTTGNALWWSPLGRLEANTPGTGGFFDAPQQRLGVFHESPIKTPQDLAQVTLERTEDPAPAAGEDAPPAPVAPSLRLGDVAQVVEDHQPLIGDAVLTNGPGILLVIEKFPEANAIEVTHEVQDALQTLAPGLSGVSIDPAVFEPATYIEKSTDDLLTWVLIGLALAVLLLALLLGWRSAVVAAVPVVVAFSAAVLALSLLGKSLNSMILAGLVLAVVVVLDDAIATTENIRRRLRQHVGPATDGSRPRLVLRAALEVRSPLAYATVIILLTLLPITVLKGEPGAFLPSIALAYGLTVVASMVAAMSVAPALGLLVFVRDSERSQPAPVRWLQQREAGALRRFSRRALPIYVSAAVLLLVGLAVVPFLERGSSLVPSFKDRDLLVSLEAPPGTSLTEMDRITARASGELRGLSGVRNVGAHVGRAVLADQIVAVNSSEIWVDIASGADYDETVASIKKAVDSYPGLKDTVLTYPNERVEQVLENDTQGDLTVRLYGQDLETLRVKADEVREAMSKIDGVVAPKVQGQEFEPTFEVKVNLAAAQASGIKPGDVRRAAATVVSGLSVGALFEQQKVFDVVVWGAPQSRGNLSELRDLILDTPNHGRVRLGDVADVRVGSAPPIIRHEDVSRSLDISADVSGRTASAVAADVKKSIKGIDFPTEYHAEVLGDYAQRASDRQTFIAVCVVVALGVFLLLQAAVGSWRLALVSFLVLPLALTGALLAALVYGGNTSLGSIMAFFAVYGIAARNLIVLMHRCRQQERRSPDGPRSEIVGQVAGERAVPVLLTAAAAVLAFLPLLVFGGGPGGEIARPLAAVVVGGLISSTFVSLFLAPALYLYVAPRPQPDETESLFVDDRDDLATDGGDGLVAATTSATTSEPAREP